MSKTFWKWLAIILMLFYIIIPFCGHLLGFKVSK